MMEFAAGMLSAYVIVALSILISKPVKRWMRAKDEARRRRERIRMRFK